MDLMESGSSISGSIWDPFCLQSYWPHVSISRLFRCTDPVVVWRSEPGYVLETWQLWQRDWQIRNSCFVADLILPCMLHVPSTLLPNYFEIFLKCAENIRLIQQSHSSNWRSRRNYMMHRGFRRTDRRRISS